MFQDVFTPYLYLQQIYLKMSQLYKLPTTETQDLFSYVKMVKNKILIQIHMCMCVCAHACAYGADQKPKNLMSCPDWLCVLRLDTIAIQTSEVLAECDSTCLAYLLWYIFLLQLADMTEYHNLDGSSLASWQSKSMRT